MSSGVYTLQLNTDKYYVGKSENVEERINQHKTLSERSAKFVKDNNGVKTQVELLTYVMEDLNLWEQQETLAQMLDKGFNNVRGWEFTSSNPLTYEECVSIKTLLFGSGDLCRKCGNPDHFVSNCNQTKANWLINLEECMNNKPKKENVFKNLINKQKDNKIESKKQDNKETTKVSNKTNNNKLPELEVAKSNRGKCKKCDLGIDKDELKAGIKTVTSNGEFIKWFHITCYKLDNVLSDDIIDNFIYQKKNNMKAECNKPKKSVKKQPVSKNVCYRCGNSNHYAPDCYATYDVDGNYIDDSEEEVWCCSYCNKEFDTEKGALFHENKYCKKKPKKQYY